MPGYVEIFDSRRTAFETCKWWKRVPGVSSRTGDVAYNEYCHRTNPEGHFYASEVQPTTQSQSQVGDSRFTRYTVTISSTDDIWGKLNQGDLVEYKNRIWRVQSMSLQPEWKRNQYARNNYEGIKIITMVS